MLNEAFKIFEKQSICYIVLVLKLYLLMLHMIRHMNYCLPSDQIVFLCFLADGVDVVSHTPRFVRDTSKYWYKPHISREDGKILIL